MNKEKAVDRGGPSRGARARGITRRDLIGGLFLFASTSLLTGFRAPGATAIAARGLYRAGRLEEMRPRRSEELQQRRVAGSEELELRTPAGAHLVLNETAREILDRCDGQRTVAEIGQAVAALYEISPVLIRSQVADTITSLIRAGVLSA